MAVGTKVLFVCMGNICRSAFAEGAARSIWGEDSIQFNSAGTYALQGNGATEDMQTVASEHGFDISHHSATPLDRADQPDVVYGMEQHHLIAARQQFPDMDATSIVLLDHPMEIADPYGESLDVYRATADHLFDVLTAMMQKWER